MDELLTRYPLTDTKYVPAYNRAELAKLQKEQARQTQSFFSHFIIQKKMLFFLKTFLISKFRKLPVYFLKNILFKMFGDEGPLRNGRAVNALTKILKK